MLINSDDKKRERKEFKWVSCDGEFILLVVKGGIKKNGYKRTNRKRY